MDNNFPPLTKGFPKFVLYSALILTSGVTTIAQANSIPLQSTATTAPIDLAYYRVYRVQPGWWYGPGPYIFPGPIYRNYGPSCKKSCIYNRHGAIIRCTKTCFY